MEFVIYVLGLFLGSWNFLFGERKKGTAGEDS